jgi:hypothetical protein
MTATAEDLELAATPEPEDLDDDQATPEPEDLDDGRTYCDGITTRGEYGGGRRRLLTNHPPIFAKNVRGNLGRLELAGIFARAAELVHTPRIGEDGYQEPEPGQDLGPAQVRPLSPGQLKALVEVRFAVQVIKTIKDEETGRKRQVYMPDMAPRDAIQTAWEAGRMGEDTPNLRELRAVTHTPAIRDDGSILDRPGYDQATGWLYLPDQGLTVPPVPERPTAAQVKVATALLLGLVDQVPWVNDDNQATWLGLAMTPILRAVLPRPTRWASSRPRTRAPARVDSRP